MDLDFEDLKILNLKQINITVVDAIMGTGKSTWAIDYINNFHSDDEIYGYGIFGDRRKFIIIVNTLTEIKRYKDSIENCYIYEPKKTKKVVEDGIEIYKGCSKTDSLNQLIAEGRNIITTHALILEADLKTRELLIAQNYTLIVDEALQVVERFVIKEDDINILLRDKVIEIDENTKQVKWIDTTYDGVFNELKRLAEKELIVSFGSDSILIRKFPESFFECFDDTFILTYLWEDSISDLYFRIFGIKCNHVSLINGELVPYNAKHEIQTKLKIKQLLTIYEDNHRGKLNRIGIPVKNPKTGKRSNPLCKSWYANVQNKEFIKVLKQNTLNYFKNNTNTPIEEILWTTFKSSKSALTNTKTRKESTFAPCNTRGTNQFKDRTAIAYLINLYYEPGTIKYFQSYNVELDGDAYALSEMIQFLWRGCIREHKPMSVYIPSERMRNLLIDWLNIADEKIKNEAV